MQHVLREYNIGSKKSRLNDRTIPKNSPVCLPYVKGQAKMFKRYVVHMISGQYSGDAWLFENISSKSSHQQNTWPRIVCIPFHAVVVKYTCSPLKVKLEERQKAVVWGEIEKLGMAYHVWKEKGKHLPLGDEVKIIDKEHLKIRHLKEALHILGNSDLLSIPSIEMNMIWEPILKKARLKKIKFWIWVKLNKNHIW